MSFSTFFRDDQPTKYDPDKTKTSHVSCKKAKLKLKAQVHTKYTKKCDYHLIKISIIKMLNIFSSFYGSLFRVSNRHSSAEPCFEFDWFRKSEN
jgi:hypothetical protein